MSHKLIARPTALAQLKRFGPPPPACVCLRERRRPPAVVTEAHDGAPEFGWHSACEEQSAIISPPFLQVVYCRRCHLQFSLTPYVLTFCFNNIIQRFDGLSLSVVLSSHFILGLRSPRSLLPSVKTVERAGGVRGREEGERES